MNNEELITIGIPVYNMGKSIKVAIDSCLAQTYNNFDILIVDDGSKDNSIQIIKDNYEKELQNEKIKIYERPQNGGVCMAMRDIVTKAKGKYLTFLDADDTMMPTRIEKQYNAIKEAEKTHKDQMVASFCGSKVNDITNNMVYNIDPNDLFNTEAEHSFGGGTGHSMYKTTDILELGNFDTDFSRSADSALCLVFLANNGYYAMVNEPLIVYNFIWNEQKKLVQKKEQEIFKKKLNPILMKSKCKDNLYLKRFAAAKYRYIKLFGFIPIITMVEYRNKKSCYLFNFINLIKIKQKKYKKNYYIFGLKIFSIKTITQFKI